MASVCAILMPFAETKPVMLAAYGQPEQGSFTSFASKGKDKAQWNRDVWRRAGSTVAEEETTGRKDPRSHLCLYVPFPLTCGVSELCMDYLMLSPVSFVQLS